MHDERTPADSPAQARFHQLMQLPPELGRSGEGAEVPGEPGSGNGAGTRPTETQSVPEESPTADQSWPAPPWLESGGPGPRAAVWHERLHLNLTRAGGAALIAVGLCAAVVAVLLMLRDGEGSATVGSVALPGPPLAEEPGAVTQLAALSADDEHPHAHREDASTAPTPDAGVPAAVGRLIVSVAGRVHNPGLVELEDGDRVADALGKAGGAFPDADLITLNLAQRVADGDQIVVGRRGSDNEEFPTVSMILGTGTTVAAGAGTASTASTGLASGQGPAHVNLNTATEAELLTLPGVGPVTASAIVEWRAVNGPFLSVEELRQVRGIGPAKIAQIRDHVTV
ncbi:helix-hairpin-helix domain-containing protein [Hoyosella sp. YIM 151337]|uniref:helix-hairpin-helix domain-containing protein n=1 Tax=Hoyosella sp. YIM 151337 TaxID=2992742 RepID=UPI002236831C|nr:helix-hairpin-helix domain-containing protein [Hoyosella sp. YIM 151337]MCW4355272.1 helix-hairpin-helix domain-containing protein [Hoyosella sp. YIM 151337]